jgi:uncharacterized protein (DUF427 family)
MSHDPNWLRAARAQWEWRGAGRPPFAVEPGPGEVSVWDFPRPPRIEPETREIVVRWGDLELVRTRSALKVLETAHPPSFYLPWNDVARDRFVSAPGSSLCEWKGRACYWTLVVGTARLERVAWSYPEPFAGAEALAGHVALYPNGLQCTVGGQPVRPQPGGFYGGWITPELVGPFKGEAGTAGW